MPQFTITQGAYSENIARNTNIEYSCALVWHEDGPDAVHIATLTRDGLTFTATGRAPWMTDAIRAEIVAALRTAIPDLYIAPDGSPSMPFRGFASIAHLPTATDMWHDKQHKQHKQPHMDTANA